MSVTLSPVKASTFHSAQNLQRTQLTPTFHDTDEVYFGAGAEDSDLSLDDLKAQLREVRELLAKLAVQADAWRELALFLAGQPGVTAIPPEGIHEMLLYTSVNPFTLIRNVDSKERVAGIAFAEDAIRRMLESLQQQQKPSKLGVEAFRDMLREMPGLYREGDPIQKS